VAELFPDSIQITDDKFVLILISSCKKFEMFLGIMCNESSLCENTTGNVYPIGTEYIYPDSNGLHSCSMRCFPVKQSIRRHFPYNKNKYLEI
jgi:hypothetical protein